MNRMTLSKRVLSDPENDLESMVEQFLRDDDRCWHIDRHVLDVDETPSFDEVSEACEAALELMRRWTSDVQRETRVIASVPIAIFDDEWLANEENSPPPHVYVCIARDRASFAPAERDNARTVARTGIALIDSLIAGSEVVARSDAFAPGEPGAWIVRVGGAVATSS